MRQPRTWAGARRIQSFLGALAIVAGVYLVCPPAALAVAGLLLLVDAIT